MKKVWVRIYLWFLLTFLGVSALFLGSIAYLQSRDSVSHGRSIEVQSTQEGGFRIPEILLFSYAASMAVAFTVTGWFVVRAAFNPVVSLNDQLDAIEPSKLQVQVRIDTDEPELQSLQKHINALLSRVSLTLRQLQSYSAQVAHELRAPLTIIRLKIEEAADKIEPTLAEEIQTELLRLTMHVEQALLIARAEQGHLKPDRIRFDLSELLNEVVEDFRLLARDQQRQIEVDSKKAPVDADPRYFKQILYSLLTNCLRHGKGTIHTAIEFGAEVTTLSIRNQMKHEDSDEAFNIGLGRRIVAALVALQGNIGLTTNRQNGWYEVRLAISAKGQMESRL